MAGVELRDIVTDADRAAALALQVGPGQGAFVASVQQSLQDAVDFAHAKPRYALDAVVAYVRRRPGADALYTSAGVGPGSPQPFYERYGFVATAEIMDDEVVLRLDLGR